jgi:RES domain-containing protein
MAQPTKNAASPTGSRQAREAVWAVVRRLLAQGRAGILVPSFVTGATVDDQNLVLWRWGPDPPHKVSEYDPTGKLPKNPLSWT